MQTEKSMKSQNTSKIDWAKKLTSRKFWLALANFVTMLIVALGGTDNEAAQISALIMAGATVIAYIIGEGLTDAANMGTIDIEDVTDVIKDVDDGK